MSDVEVINRYFLKFFNLKNKIYFKEQEKKLLIEKKTSLSSPNYESLKSSSKRQDLSNILSQIEDLEKYLDKLYKKRDKMIDDYLKDFQQLSNANFTIILKQFYLDKISLKMISNNLDLSLSHTKKIKKQAVNELLDFIKKST